MRQPTNGLIPEEAAMDEMSFDHLTVLLCRFISRRATLGGLSALTLPSLVDAKKRNRKKRKTKRVTFNDFGCVNVGNFCKNGGQCCSGICEGKKGKRTCVAHDVGVCEANSDICAAGQEVRCGIYNANCFCVSTTGDAPFCGDFTSPSLLCRDCSQDADCEEEFGLGAACVVYGGACASWCPQTGGTSCLPACNDSSE
jgi:hypothetical protein